MCQPAVVVGGFAAVACGPLAGTGNNSPAARAISRPSARRAKTTSTCFRSGSVIRVGELSGTDHLNDLAGD